MLALVYPPDNISLPFRSLPPSDTGYLADQIAGFTELWFGAGALILNTSQVDLRGISRMRRIWDSCESGKPAIEEVELKESKAQESLLILDGHSGAS